MKKIFLAVIAALVLVGFVNAQNRQGDSRLREVRKIYVDKLGSTDDADIVREKIKLRISKTGKYIIVEQREDADAILTGTVVMTRQIEGSARDIDTETKAVAIFYLRDAGSSETLWTYEFSPKFFDIEIITDKATHGYNQVAKRTVEKLIKAAGFSKK